MKCRWIHWRRNIITVAVLFGNAAGKDLILGIIAFLYRTESWRLLVELCLSLVNWGPIWCW